jgi:hypothetical protein
VPSGTKLTWPATCDPIVNAGQGCGSVENVGQPFADILCVERWDALCSLARVEVTDHVTAPVGVNGDTSPNRQCQLEQGIEFVLIVCH